MFSNVKVIGADAATTTAAPGTGLQVATVAARLFTVSAYNAGSTTLYLQAFDAASEPADGATTYPKLVTPVYSHTAGGFNFTDGAIFGAGIYLCFSTTDTYKTRTGATSGLMDATYRKR